MKFPTFQFPSIFNEEQTVNRLQKNFALKNIVQRTVAFPFAETKTDCTQRDVE